jgi:hypothetical protein
MSAVSAPSALVPLIKPMAFCSVFFGTLIALSKINWGNDLREESLPMVSHPDAHERYYNPKIMARYISFLRSFFRLHAYDED